MRVARRQGRRVGAGSCRGSVGGFWKAAAGGRRRVRRAAGRRGAAGHTRRAYRPHVRWAPARRPAANPAAQPRSQQTPLARPQTWAFCTLPSRAVARLGLLHLPAVLLKRVVGRSLSPSVVRPCAWRAARAASVGAGSRRRSVGRTPSLRWAGAVGSRGARRAGLTMPAGIAAPTRACAVGARPPPRCPTSRPTALAADTAGAARNLGVFYTRVACRRVSRSITPASGAAEASRWANLSLYRPCHAGPG